MKQTVLLFTALIAWMPESNAVDFFVEDDSMVELPAPIAKVIINAEGVEKLQDGRNPKNGQCKLIGKSVDLGLGRDSGYVATTANGCNWGASAGPIWVVLAKPLPSVVFSYGGVELTLGKPLQNGLRNIATGDGTAGWSQEILWKFDGAHYVKVKEKSCQAQEDSSMKCSNSTTKPK